MEKALTSIGDAVSRLTSKSDCHLIHQYSDRLRLHKTELKAISDELLAMNLEDTDDLYHSQHKLDDLLFDCELSIRKIDTPPSPASSSDADHHGVKLPKLLAPTFDGKLTSWMSFWEQFDIAIHSRTTLSNVEKLAYLRNSIKDGSAKGIIEGLSTSGEQYTEAIDTLKARYDRPRLIHQSHVRAIVEAPELKNATGREIRKLHDTTQQHLRALKAMGFEPSGPFITSILELKLDPDTSFEWQKTSQKDTGVPHYSKLLDFLNLCAQASEASAGDTKKPMPRMEDRSKKGVNKQITSFTANTSESSPPVCCLCKTDKHFLFACPRFKALSHEQKRSTIKSNDFCINCLRPGHFVRQCRSTSRCRKCDKSHNTLLHIEHGMEPLTPPIAPTPATPVTSLTANMSSGSGTSLLMTCRVLSRGANGTSIESRALLDSASSVSFVSERLAQALRLPRSHRNASIQGVAGLSHSLHSQSFTTLVVSPLQDPRREITVNAVITPRVTCDLPTQRIPFDTSWQHLADLTLADPDFGLPGKIDLLLGVDVFVDVMRQGRRRGAPGNPSAFETDFGWVLAGEASSSLNTSVFLTHHVTVDTDNLLQKFWELEEQTAELSSLTSEELSVVQHFKDYHSRESDGRFIVPLPKKPFTKPLGESRSHAVRRHKSLEKSLYSRGVFDQYHVVMEEYFEKEHAELVPPNDLKKPASEVFYLPLHVVFKDSSTTTKVRAVFDASAPSTSGVSLNNLLLVGPTVHSSLVDVLIRFRLHRIALTTDVSRMYRMVLLEESDKDLHRFVWKRGPFEPLRDYRMTRVTFGVAASSYAANMAIKQNAEDFASEFPTAAKVVEEAFYVDDGLTGADSPEEAIYLQQELQQLFARGGFTLRKWNCSNPTVLKSIPEELRDPRPQCTLPSDSEYTKTLGVEWNTVLDHFRLKIAKLPPVDNITKRFLVSDVARTFDVLGWYSPCTIVMKILFQQLWEMKVDWDEVVPEPVRDSWLRWRSELDLLSTKHIPRCYHDKCTSVVSMELHGFSDASERAYAAVIYLRMECTDGRTQIALITSKTKVAPIKRLTIPRLELCGAKLLAQLMHHVRIVLDVPIDRCHAWTDSSVVLHWLRGSPRRFKTYVGNRVSDILELFGLECWHHVRGVVNPADCASRGLYPSELIKHELWWQGPDWLKLPPSSWPDQSIPQPEPTPEEEKEVCFTSHVIQSCSLVSSPASRV